MWLTVNHNISVTRMANGFDVRSVLHMQVSLAADNYIYVFHEAKNGCKKKNKDSLKACFENVNITVLQFSYKESAG